MNSDPNPNPTPTNMQPQPSQPAAATAPQTSPASVAIRASVWLQAGLVAALTLLTAPLMTVLTLRLLPDFSNQTDSVPTFQHLLLQGLEIGLSTAIGNLLLGLITLAIFKRIGVTLTTKLVTWYLVLIVVLTVADMTVAMVGAYLLVYSGTIVVAAAWLLASRLARSKQA